MLFGSRALFDYLQCGRCGCLQLANPPEDMRQYYPAGYYSHKESAARRSTHPLKRYLRLACDRYAVQNRGLVGRIVHARYPNSALRSLAQLRLAPTARILDVGCGTGGLLCRLADQGFQHLTGIDPFIEKDIQHQNGKVTVLKCAPEDLDDGKGPWDLIMSHHSFEHMPEPERALQRMAALLSGTGTCLIRTPTVSSFAWQEYGTDWVQIDAPRHLFVHSRESMRILAEKAGLRVEHVIYDSSEMQFWASEQYRQDIPLLSDRSHRKNPSGSIFSRRQIREFRRRARQLNASGQGDQAAFYLRKGEGI